MNINFIGSMLKGVGVGGLLELEVDDWQQVEQGVIFIFFSS